MSGNDVADSPLRWTRLRLKWKVVKLWTVPAADLLAAGDVGLVPWVPLAQINGPAEPVFQECRDRIDRQAPAEERENLLAVIQVLGRLRYDVALLERVFGGRQAMIESPLIKELVAEVKQGMILRNLTARFQTVPTDVASAVQGINDPDRLDELGTWSAVCPDLAAFRTRLTI